MLERTAYSTLVVSTYVRCHHCDAGGYQRIKTKRITSSPEHEPHTPFDTKSTAQQTISAVLISHTPSRLRLQQCRSRPATAAATEKPCTKEQETKAGDHHGERREPRSEVGRKNQIESRERVFFTDVICAAAAAELGRRDVRIRIGRGFVLGDRSGSGGAQSTNVALPVSVEPLGGYR